MTENKDIKFLEEEEEFCELQCRTRGGVMDCDYCHEDSRGYFRLLPRKDEPSNSHVFLYRRLGGKMALTGTFSGKDMGDYDIKFCPMCGRELNKDVE